MFKWYKIVLSVGVKLEGNKSPLLTRPVRIDLFLFNENRTKAVKPHLPQRKQQISQTGFLIVRNNIMVRAFSKRRN